MRPSIFYKAVVNEVEKIDRIIQLFDREIYNPLKLDFPFNKKWLKLPGQYTRGNFEEYLKEAYHDWAKSCHFVYGGRIPKHFKGIVLDLDPEAGSLALVFGMFADDDWRCHNHLPTYRVEKGFPVHVEAIELLRELKPLVDELTVDDGTGLWQSEDLEMAKRKFLDGYLLKKKH